MRQEKQVFMRTVYIASSNCLIKTNIIHKIKYNTRKTSQMVKATFKVKQRAGRKKGGSQLPLTG